MKKAYDTVEEQNDKTINSLGFPLKGSDAFAGWDETTAEEKRAIIFKKMEEIQKDMRNQLDKLVQLLTTVSQ